jgi:hypothetical protein
MLFAQRFQHLWKSESLRHKGWMEAPAVPTAAKLSQRCGRDNGRGGPRVGRGAGPPRFRLTSRACFSKLRALRGGGLSIRGPSGRPRQGHPRRHEAHVPAEQPSPEEDPRLPGAHADQGRPARAEEAPSEGAQADRGLGQRGGPAWPAAPAPGPSPQRSPVPESVPARDPGRRKAVPVGGRRERLRARPAGPGRGPAAGAGSGAQPRPPAAEGGVPALPAAGHAGPRPGPPGQTRGFGLHARRSRP